MYRWFLALRYLLNRPINLLGVVGVMLGTWALIVVVSIFSGYIVEIRAHIRSTTSDVSISNLPAETSFAAVREVLERDPNVALCTPRFTGGGMLHPSRLNRAKIKNTAAAQLGAESRFVHLLGIDPSAEPSVSGLGEWLDHVARPDLRVAPKGLLAPTAARPTLLLSEQRILGEGLAAGDRVRITCALLRENRTQSVDAVQIDLDLQGAFASKYVLFDASTAIVDIATMRKLHGVTTPDACNVVAVKLRDPRQDRATAERLERALREAIYPGVRAQDWEATNIPFLAAIDHQRFIMKLVLFIIMVVAAFLMFATLSMMVTEKVHDIGILSAMGGTRLGVMQVFLTCGLAISLLGTLLGIVAGCFTATYLDAFNQWVKATFAIDLFPTTIYNLRRVPYELDPLWIAQVAAMALVVGILVSAWPAWRASRHNPVESLRAE